MRTANPMQKECPYDVGDILQTRNAAHPSTRWPGTIWEAITSMLLGASDAHPAGSTGGAESASYTPSGTIGGTALTTNQIPAHSHVERWPSSFASYASSTLYNVRNVADTTNKTTTAGVRSDDGYATADGGMSSSSSYGAVTTGSAGGGQSHTHGFTGTSAEISTMPPYTAVYIWERTG